MAGSKHVHRSERHSKARRLVCDAGHKQETRELLPSSARCAPSMRMTHAAMVRLAEQYGLTATEARVLRAVVDETGGVRAISSAIGLSEATLKTHLHHLFRKTGSQWQVDLVKLVLIAARRSTEG